MTIGVETKNWTPGRISVTGDSGWTPIGVMDNCLSHFWSPKNTNEISVGVSKKNLFFQI